MIFERHTPSLIGLVGGRFLAGIILGMTLLSPNGFAMNNTRESLAEFIPTRVYKHPETEKILDFHVEISREKITDPENLVSLVSALANCLSVSGKDSLCGAHPEVGEVYFDEQGTNAHLYLNRALEVGFVNKIDFKDLLVKVFSVKSERTQRVVLQGINKLKKAQWLSIGEKILPELEVRYYLKILGDRELDRSFRNQTRAKLRKAVARSLYDADQLLKLKSTFAEARITNSDLRYVCRNAERKDVLFRSIKSKLGIERICEDI